MFRLSHAAVSVALLVSLLASCGSGDEPDAAKPPPTPSPTPTPTVETVPPQPKGAYGVTMAITNWDEYYDNEPVVAWKEIYEAAAASINRGKIVPGFRGTHSRKEEQIWLNAMDIAWARKMKVPRRGDVRIASARVRGDAARLVVCLWSPTTDYVSPDKLRAWRKNLIRLRKSDRWKVTTFREIGRCKGGAPR